jgi:hypothetical protein
VRFADIRGTSDVERFGVERFGVACAQIKQPSANLRDRPGAP